MTDQPARMRAGPLSSLVPAIGTGWGGGSRADRTKSGDGRLDNGKARDSHKPKSGAIDLGNEPPLSVDGGLRTDFDRRRVSVRWLSGTILTGLCGAALMGGAVFAALDGEAHFAANPERVEPTLRGSIGNRATARKSDRLPPVIESNAARQVIRTTTMTRVGEREVPRVKPFIRVSSNLTLSVSELSANIPRFNPQRALSNMDDDTVAAEERPDAAPDAEVSFVTRDLASVMPRMRVAVLVPLEEVITRVRDAANWTGSVPPKFTLASTQAGGLAYAAQETPADPYAPFETRITAENITMLPKTAAQATGGNAWSERLIPIKKGDTLSGLLRDLGATPEEIKAISAVLGTRARDGNLKDGQKLRVLLSPVRSTQRLQPVRVILVGDSTIEAVVALSDLGKYVGVDVQIAEAPVVEAEDEEEDDGSGVRLYQSIYETALRNSVPRPIVDELIRVYSYDVRFPAQGAARRLPRGALHGRRGKQRRQTRRAVRIACGRRRVQEILPLCFTGRRRRRLLRRNWEEREEVSGPQARERRDYAIRVRFASPSDPRLHQDAYGRGLGGPDGYADLCVG